VTVKERKLSKDELREKVQKLQEQLAVVTAERDQLLLEKESTKKEYEEELRSIQQSLDEAVEQKNAIMTKHEKEYEQLRTVNADREQQMLDDFEWKLREVEKNSKKRIEEKTKEAERRIKDVQVKLDLRTAMHVDDVRKTMTQSLFTRGAIYLCLVLNRLKSSKNSSQR
jgi:CHASE3 domain sensor protein